MQIEVIDTEVDFARLEYYVEEILHTFWRIAREVRCARVGAFVNLPARAHLQEEVGRLG